MNFERCAVLILASLVVAVPFAGAEDTIVGEVVDSACFLRNESRGSDHQECAARCLRNGNPVGILTDEGELYTLAASAAAYESFAAKRVRVAGKLVDRTLAPAALEVWESDAWVVVPLSKFGAPESK